MMNENEDTKEIKENEKQMHHLIQLVKFCCKIVLMNVICHELMIYFFRLQKKLLLDAGLLYLVIPFMVCSFDDSLLHFKVIFVTEILRNLILVMCLRTMAQFIGGETRYSSWNIIKNGLEIYRYEGVQGFFEYETYFRMKNIIEGP